MGLEERIARWFEIARQEGALRKWADGKSDAEDVLAEVAQELREVKQSDKLDSWVESLISKYGRGHE